MSSEYFVPRADETTEQWFARTKPVACIKDALAIAHSYGTVDGDHHKAWVIDQMVSRLLSWSEYEQWLKDHEGWDKGIAP